MSHHEPSARLRVKGPGAGPGLSWPVPPWRNPEWGGAPQILAGVKNKLLRGHTLGMVTRHWPDRGTGCKYIKIMPSVLQQLVTAHFKLCNRWGNMFNVHIVVFSIGVGMPRYRQLLMSFDNVCWGGIVAVVNKMGGVPLLSYLRDINVPDAM